MGLPKVANQDLSEFAQENNCRLKGDIETLADGTRVVLAERLAERVKNADPNYDEDLAALFLKSTEKHDTGTLNSTRNALRIIFQTADGQTHILGKDMPENKVQMIMENANSGEMMKKLSNQAKSKE